MSATETEKVTSATLETVAELFHSHPSLDNTGAKPGWKVALECLLVVWAVFCVAMVTLVIALYVPGHLGLSNFLQGLSNLFPSGFPYFTT